jgi:hypothetical protein
VGHADTASKSSQGFFAMKKVLALAVGMVVIVVATALLKSAWKS